MQALTNIFLHDLRSVGIYNKSEFNTIKMAQPYPVLTWKEFRSDMHQAFMVNGHYTKYESNINNI